MQMTCCEMYVAAVHRENKPTYLFLSSNTTPLH